MSAGTADLILYLLNNAIDQDKEYFEGKTTSSPVDTPRFKCHTEMAIRLLERQQDCQGCRCRSSVPPTEEIGEAVGLDERREGIQTETWSKPHTGRKYL